jgi:ferrochelatase
MARAFDAVLVIAFGGPQGRGDVRPFLENVLRGRRVAPERIDEVAHHYDLFDGISPITELTARQAGLLLDRLRERGNPLPVYVGMRNWHPFLEDTLAAMSRDGVRRAIGFIAAPHRSYSSCTQYRENVEAARAKLRSAGLDDVEIVFVGDWHTHPGFIDANAEHVREALMRLPEEVRDQARLVFTAHSIPVAVAERFPYQRQLEETAQAVADRVAELGGQPPFDAAQGEPFDAAQGGPFDAAQAGNWVLVYQSRSGRPEDPWLGPDVCEYLRHEATAGLQAAVLCPVGFVCDHIEVLYDLDTEAAAVCRDIGLPMTRANAVNDHPRFVEAMADAVIQTIERYGGGRPLKVVSPARARV